MKRDVLTMTALVAGLEEEFAVQGGLVYPQQLLATWAHHKPIFLRLPGKSADAWLSRAIMEADQGHQLLVCAPSHMETARVQKLLANANEVLFLNKRLNVDQWSEGAFLAGLNINIPKKLDRYGVIMRKVST